MFTLSSVLLAATASGAPIVAHADNRTDTFSNIIVVSGHLNEDGLQEHIQPTVAAPSSDAASLVARVAGAALVGNGPISGQVEYRGLFSDRLAIRVNGQKFQSGGPNAMDPPLHYAPMILVDNITISRGTGSVSDGMGLGGAINANIKSIDFSLNGKLRPQIKSGVSVRSPDQSFAIGGVAGFSNDRWRVQALGAYEKGEDLRIGGGGTARATSFERLNYGIGGGFRYGSGELSLEWRRQETSPSGNPAFAMDINFFNGDFLHATTKNEIGQWSLKSAFGFSRITHGMNNFGLRSAPSDRSAWRVSLADADSMTAQFVLENNHFTFSVDGELVDRNVRITNPNNNNFWISSLNQVQQQRFGISSELHDSIGAINFELGARLDFHMSRMADPKVGKSVPQMLANWAAQYAKNNQSLHDQTGDIVLRLWNDSGLAKPRLTLAYKQRVANAVERHSWMPTEASGGLADGNIYIGNINLRPEKAWIAEAGVDVKEGNFIWRPSIFYRRIDDFIQGVPVPEELSTVRMIAAMNGDATPLIFANVDAEFYGTDMDMRWHLSDPWSIDATLSYVRGKRRDIKDNLYRVAPLNGRLALHWTKNEFNISGELVGAAAQNKVSLNNDEKRNPSWLIANIWSEIQLSSGLSIALGIENIWDQRIADHLSGINRVTGSVVKVGERIPTGGRGLSLKIMANL